MRSSERTGSCSTGSHLRLWVVGIGLDVAATLRVSGVHGVYTICQALVSSLQFGRLAYEFLKNCIDIPTIESYGKQWIANDLF